MTKFFDGLSFVLDLPISTKTVQKNQYVAFIKDNGGQVDFALSSKTTHLITHDINGFKAKSGYKIGCCVVTDKYLIDCMTENKRCDILPYLSVNGELVRQNYEKSINSSIDWVSSQLKSVLSDLDFNVRPVPTTTTLPLKSIPTSSITSTKHSTPSSYTKYSAQTVSTSTTSPSTSPTKSAPSTTSSSVLNVEPSSASVAAVSLFQQTLNQRKLELEKKNQEIQLQLAAKQVERQKALDQKKLEKEEKIRLMNLEKEKKIQAESERRKSVLERLNIKPTSYLEASSLTSSHSSIKLNNPTINSKHSKQQQVPINKKSKKQEKQEKREQDETQKRLAKEERTRIYNENKIKQDQLDKETKEKEMAESLRLFLLREEKRKKKLQLEMEKIAAESNPDTPKSTTEVKKVEPKEQPGIHKDLRKIFVGGIDFVELEKKYSRKPSQLSKLKLKKISYLIPYFNQFGQVEERSVAKDHFFITYQKVEDAQRAVEHFKVLENRKLLTADMEKKLTESKAELLLACSSFYVRLTKSVKKVQLTEKNQQEKKQKLESQIQKEMDAIEDAGWTIV